MSDMKLPKIVPQAKEQPPKTGASAGTTPKNMPGKMKGDKMAHEIMNDKMSKKLGC